MACDHLESLFCHTQIALALTLEILQCLHLVGIAVHVAELALVVVLEMESIHHRRNL